MQTESILITDEEQRSAAEELSITDDQYYRLHGDEVTHFLTVGKVRSCYFPLREITMRNMEREGPTHCPYCGREIESSEYVWVSGRICCLDCGERYRFTGAEEYVCNRCGEDIDSGDIYCFPESETYEDLCLCGRCALIKHLHPLWHTWLKNT